MAATPQTSVSRFMIELSIFLIASWYALNNSDDIEGGIAKATGYYTLGWPAIDIGD